MQDGLNAAALINTIVMSLMRYHGTELVVTNPVLPQHLQHAAFLCGGRGILSEFTPLSSCWKELSEGPYFILRSFQSTLYSTPVFHLYLMHKNESTPRRCLFQWLWWDRCPGKLSKMCRAKKGELSDGGWTVSCHPHWIDLCIPRTSVPGLLQFRHLQASGLPTSDDYSRSWPFPWQHALAAFADRYMTHSNLHLSHISKYFKTF